MKLDNRYELLTRIGSGGMALVYKARCHKLDRFVAVKILKEELAVDSDFRERFQNESKAVAMLSHANIVNVYDVSRSSNPDYIVMELIEGLTLKEYMENRGGELSWKEALHFTTQITKALIHAHSRGIIHRDIKPHNIMLLQDSSVKVTDFGIARLASKNTAHSLTRDAMGSVHYMSPEQAVGGAVDKRSDIYSLGVVLYEMLTGRLPFEAETSVAIALQHVNATPLSPREINPKIPKGLEEIVLRMMAQDINKRYASAEALYDDLEAFRTHPEVEFKYNPATYITGSSDKKPDSQPNVIVVPNNDVKVLPRETEVEPVYNNGNSGGFRKRSTPVAWLAGVGIILVVFITAFFFLWNFLLKDMFSDPPSLMVPDWSNISYDIIYSKPEYVGYFTFERVDASNSIIERGKVIAQDPAAGRKVNWKEGSPVKVKLTVSKGADDIIIPNMVNKEYRSGLITLGDLGLRAGEPTYELSDDISSGYIIRTDPEAGETRHPGDPIEIVVSLGPEIKYLLVPDLYGRAFEDAQKIIEDMNLTLGEIKLEPSEAPYGMVIRQGIAPNTEVQEYARIDLTISDESLAATPDPLPEPIPEPEPTPITFPDQTPDPYLPANPENTEPAPPDVIQEVL
jgi:serine/threonine-protein kinase